MCRFNFGSVSWEQSLKSVNGFADFFPKAQDNCWHVGMGHGHGRLALRTRKGRQPQIGQHQTGGYEQKEWPGSSF